MKLRKSWKSSDFYLIMINKKFNFHCHFFSTNSKPRPAPTYSQDPFSDFAEYQNLDTPFVNDQKCPYRNSISNTQSPQHYFLNETSNNYNNNDNNDQHPIPSCRPLSNVAMPSNQYSMPPRASSDTQSSMSRQKNINTNLFTTPPPLTTTPSPQSLQINSRLKADLDCSYKQTSERVNIQQYHGDNEEHKLIARYSQELRQYSEPELVKKILFLKIIFFS